ncbi:MAG: hypothetical protein ACYDGM_05625, partial [Vulcanimicrobiaceae bacterium]
AAERRRVGLAEARGTSARGKAEATALASSSGVAREDIVAARRERRARQKAPRQPKQAQSARYKRKRADGTTIVENDTETIGVLEASDMYESLEGVDPLDAQNFGLHDQAFDQGHEEITLNLEGFEPEQGTEHDQADRERTEK